MKTTTKNPKFNGRPQLWFACGEGVCFYDKLRIIYPSGRVEYSCSEQWYRGCTSRRSQEAALAAVRKYNDDWSNDQLYFLGYL